MRCRSDDFLYLVFSANFTVSFCVLVPNVDLSTSYLFFNTHIYRPIYIYRLHSHYIYIYIRACMSVCMYVRLGARLTIYRIRHTSAVAATKTLSHPHPISRPLKIKGFGRTKWIWKEKFLTTKSIPTIPLCAHTYTHVYVIYIYCL